MLSREDIIEMAREAGLLPCQGIHPGDLERFFQLTYEAGAAAEREACAKVCDEYGQAKYAASAIRARSKT